jgi:hypothetical protein
VAFALCCIVNPVGLAAYRPPLLPPPSGSWTLDPCLGSGSIGLHALHVNSTGSKTAFNTKSSIVFKQNSRLRNKCKFCLDPIGILCRRQVLNQQG